MPAFTKINQFTLDALSKVHNIGSDSLMVMLTNTMPVVSTAKLLADLTDLSTSGGYTAGGAVIPFTSLTGSAGTAKLLQGSLTFTATTGFGPFRYAVLYNATPTSPLKPLIGFWDYGSAVTLAAGETFTVTPDATNGTFTLA